MDIQNYTIDQSRMCFCIDGGVLVRITVKSDIIFNVERLSDGTVVTNHYYLSVDSLFGIIENDSLVIKYNTQYGFREFLDVNPQEHPVDGGVLYETSNLQTY